MSDERTQTPSRRRRQEARERGLVARSPDLTAAIGLLAAVLLLGAFGGQLVGALVALMREPWVEPLALATDPLAITARIRHQALGVAIPLGFIAGGVVLAMIAAHQAQVGGLWVPGLLAPDLRRMWKLGASEDLSARGARGAWRVARAVIILLLAGSVVYSRLPMFQRLGHLDAPSLAVASGTLLRELGYTVALAILALGAIDFLLQYRRFETLLQPTPEQQREDQRAEDGDPMLRSRRRRMAQAWNQNPREMLAGATLVLSGPSGLAVVLSGGPPPRRINVRPAAQGLLGWRLRRAAEQAEIPLIEAPELARQLARRPSASRALPPDCLAELALLWPQPSPRSGPTSDPPS